MYWEELATSSFFHISQSTMKLAEIVQ